MDAGIAIDNIKSLIKQAQGENNIKIYSGEGISVSRAADGYRVSAFQNEVDQPRLYTFQICVNGTSKNLDVFVAGEPY
jgi:hypothetical protein